MKTLGTSLTNALKDGIFAILIKIETKNGDVMGFTNHDISITRDGVVYQTAPGLTGIKSTFTSDTAVQEQQLGQAWTVDLNEDDLLSGKFDEAIITFGRTDWRDLDPSAEVSIDGVTQIAGVKSTRDGFIANVESGMRRLQTPIGYKTQPSCPYKFGSVQNSTNPRGCGVNLASWTFNKTITSVTDRRTFSIGLTGLDAGRLQNGTITFTSGPNSGLTTEIKTHSISSNDDLTTFFQTFRLPQVGDTVTVVAGCKKTATECQFFNNIANFGGFPHITPEANTSL